MTLSETLKREQSKSKRTELEDMLAQQMRAVGIEYRREVTFWPGRRWRFDFTVDRAWLAIEVQGGIWTGGGHSRGSGQLRDAEKAAHAAIAGWRLMPVTGNHIKSGEAIRWIQQSIAESRK